MKHADKNAAKRKSASPKVREALQAALQATMMTAPDSISEPQLSRSRKLLSQNDRGDQSDEQRHATRIERALVASRCKV